MTLERKLNERTARAAVIGLGYVGLPQALAMAQAGFRTTGLDVDANRVATLKAGRSHIEDVSPAQLRRLLRARRFEASTDFGALTAADVITICVPTPLSKTKDPDVSYIQAATDQVARHLRTGQLVILESTTYPGTTEEIIRPVLEKTGLVAGRDFFLAFSPERIDPANARFTVKNTPKVVGGLTTSCTKLAAAFYRQFVDEVVPVSSPQTAEMAKLLENTFRNINIAMVNELAMMCDVLGVDVYEVIGAAATKPFGFMPFYPGPGLGGHCIPVDPEYLAWKLKAYDFKARFISLAAEVNTAMPQVVVTKVGDALNAVGQSLKGARVLILGVAYKKNVGDVRESPALTVISLLRARGAKVAYHDPHVPRVRVGGGTMASTRLTVKVVQAQDCVVLLTDHAAFDVPRLVRKSRIFVDTRNATHGLGRFAHKIVKLGAPSALLAAIKGEAA